MANLGGKLKFWWEAKISQNLALFLNVTVRGLILEGENCVGLIQIGNFPWSMQSMFQKL